MFAHESIAKPFIVLFRALKNSCPVLSPHRSYSQWPSPRLPTLTPASYRHIDSHADLGSSLENAIHFDLEEFMFAFFGEGFDYAANVFFQHRDRVYLTRTSPARDGW
jgi:hypothetical protein